MDIFCKIINGEIPSFTVYENEYVKCIMDANPETPGHTLVIPKKHYTTILDMDKEIIVEVQEAAQMLISKMESSFKGVIGVRAVVNYGVLQAVKHYHLHLIPVYKEEPKMTQEEACNILKG